MPDNAPMKVREPMSAITSLSLGAMDVADPKYAEKLERLLFKAMELIDWQQVELPPLSPMADQLIEISGSTQLSHEHITTLVESEPAFAAKVMAYANTSSELPTAVTLKQALRRLDEITVIQKIEEVADNDFNDRYSEISRHLLRKMWTHDIFTAHGARELARWTQRADPEEAFVSAMFSNVATPVFICAITRMTQGDPALLAYAPDIIQFITTKQRGMSRHILGSWQFSERICSFPSRLIAPQGDDLATIVSLASEVALDYGYSYGGLYGNSRKYQEYLRVLNLEHSTVGTLSEVIGPSLNAALSIVPSI